MTIKVQVLGCGFAPGVPMISKGWGRCNPDNPKNTRLRSCLYAKIDGGTGLLFDSGPDLRQQLLTAGVPKIDAVLYTHLHADHTDGVNELREINRINGAALPIFADAPTMQSLKERFGYAFADIDMAVKPLYHVLLKEHLIKPYQEFEACGVKVMPFLQGHGYMDTLGFRIGDFAYSTDAELLENRALEVLRGVKVWVVGCLQRDPHPTHAGLAQVLEWIDKVKPERAYLTHMGISLDYDELCAELPSYIRPAYDGLTFSV